VRQRGSEGQGDEAEVDPEVEAWWYVAVLRQLASHELFLVYRRHVLMLQCSNSFFLRLTDSGPMVTYRRNRAAVWVCVASFGDGGDGRVRCVAGGVFVGSSKVASKGAGTGMQDDWQGARANCGGKRALNASV
jgi:hypothetical protein